MTGVWSGKLIAQRADNSDEEIPGLEFEVVFDAGRNEIHLAAVDRHGLVVLHIYLLNSEGAARVEIAGEGNKSLFGHSVVVNDGADLQKRRELATRLAGYRMVQRLLSNLASRHSVFADNVVLSHFMKHDPIWDILTDGKEIDPLTSYEIDKLCEKLNTEVDNDDDS
jgi:hypothetical protein